MDGYEATRRLRATPDLGGVVILASSANASDEARRESLRAGCNDVVQKPVLVSALFDKIQRFLGVEWIRSEESSPAPAAKDDRPLVPPLAEDLSLLSRLVASGRVRSVLVEAARMEQSDPRLSPWLAELRGLVRTYQMRRLREFIDGSAAGGAATPVPST